MKSDGKGKCFSMVNQGQRKPSDLYETPYSMTEQLFDRAVFHGNSIWEPACGNGAMVKIIRERCPGSYIHASDIEIHKDGTWGANLVSLGSFLTMDSFPNTDTIITNPPFSLAHEFILRAKQVANKHIAMLLPLSYLHGQKRYEEIWKDHNFPLARILVFTRYPMLGDPLRVDGKYRTGMQVYAWYIWDKSYIGYPEIEWIDNNQYVLKKGE